MQNIKLEEIHIILHLHMEDLFGVQDGGKQRSKEAVVTSHVIAWNHSRIRTMIGSDGGMDQRYMKGQSLWNDVIWW